MTVNEYDIVHYYDYHYSNGMPYLVSQRTLAMLTKAVGKLGYKEELTLDQASYHTGVAQSAQTHWADGVVDLAPNDWENKCDALMWAGFMPFHREYNWDNAGGMEHIHAVDAGSTKLNYQAAAQRVDWARHLNGLADHAPYTGPWHPIKRYVWEAPKQPPPAPPVGQFQVMLDAQLHTAIEHTHAGTLQTEWAAIGKDHPNWSTVKDNLTDMTEILARYKAIYQRTYKFNHTPPK